MRALVIDASIEIVVVPKKAEEQLPSIPPHVDADGVDLGHVTASNAYFAPSTSPASLLATIAPST